MTRFRPSLCALEARENPASFFVASGAIAGGLPLVEVVNPGGIVISTFQAFESTFTGGVRADTGELDGNPATVEVAVAPGPGGGPRVQVYAVRIDTGATTKIGDFFAYEDSFRDGVRIAVGDIDGVAGGLDQIVVGTDQNGGPRVRAFRFDGFTPTPLTTPLGNFFAFEPEFRGGVRVAAGELDGNLSNGDELVVAAGPGGGPRVRVLRGDGTVVNDFYAFAPTTTAGVNLQYDVVTGLVRYDLAADDFSQRSARLNAPILAALAAAASGFNQTGTTGFNTVATGFTISQDSGSTTTTSGSFGPGGPTTGAATGTGNGLTF
ncbi:hypothetical protein [Urbifossiella limnaea]|uniref:Uncharacterized protein n=1 Tax=Urbifossiella limnaea TaxID=2528023 RepID=A0A517XP44_9BACT|nr:hypothetical protein [Urbifossiella limnaea]QDU19280.1 hypothetical protein ETAA1_11860 [Urbifossiella limnaea]